MLSFGSGCAGLVRLLGLLVALEVVPLCLAQWNL